jgi:hypothetical protein
MELWVTCVGGVLSLLTAVIVAHIQWAHRLRIAQVKQRGATTRTTIGCATTAVVVITGYLALRDYLQFKQSALSNARFHPDTVQED